MLWEQWTSSWICCGRELGAVSTQSCMCRTSPPTGWVWSEDVSGCVCSSNCLQVCPRTSLEVNWPRSLRTAGEEDRGVPGLCVRERERENMTLGVGEREKVYSTLREVF